MRLSFLLSVTGLTVVISSLFLVANSSLVVPEASSGISSHIFSDLITSLQGSGEDDDNKNDNEDVGFSGLLPEASAGRLPLQLEQMYGGIKKTAIDNDLTSFGYLEIDQNYIDDTKHCEFCTRVEYVSTTKSASGFSFEDQRGFDLTGAKRVKFMILGENGGESVSFRAAGKTLPDGDTMNDIFGREKFAVYTRNIELEAKWKTIEIDLQGKNLKQITHPLAFVLNEGGDNNHNKASQGRVIFYIKNLVFDQEIPTNPAPTENAPQASNKNNNR